MTLQLPLNIGLRESADFTGFVAGENAQAVADLRACAAGDGEPFVYLWGNRGCGRSHLLQAACRLADEQLERVAYLPLDQHAALDPTVLGDLGGPGLVCLDDIDQVIGRTAWAEALFVLFNQLRDGGGRLLVSADRGPARLEGALPDLLSRLQWGVSYQLKPLDEAGRMTVLTGAAQRRGLELPADTARFIMRHTARDIDSLMQLLERLDQASLAAQRRLTIPFVRGLIGPS